MENKIYFRWAFVCYFLGLFIFMVGFHDIDTAMNMKPYEIDYGFVREPVAMMNLYINGVMKLFMSLILFAGSSVVSLFGFYDKQNNK